jgi:hypothetical protein
MVQFIWIILALKMLIFIRNCNMIAKIAMQWRGA